MNLQVRTRAAFLILLFATMSLARTGKPSLPSQGVVPDETTAVKVAGVLLPPIFGDEEVSKYLPYHAQLRGGVWTVYGTLKPGFRGGTPMMTIRKDDAKVLEVWHSQ
jgi:hypothetical protein